MADGDYYSQDDGVYSVRVFHVDDTKRGKPRRRYRVRAYYHGHRDQTEVLTTLASLNKVEKLGRQLWQDYVDGLHDAPEAAPVTVQGLIDRFCAREMTKRGKQLSESTRQTYKQQLQALTRITGPDMPLDRLAQRHVEAIKGLTRLPRGKKADPTKPPTPLSRRTIETYLRAVKALMAWAYKQDFIRRDFAHDVVYDAGPVVMRPWLQPHEIQAYLDACPPAFRIRAGIMIETGLRADELVHLRWAWVQQGIGRSSIRIPGRDPVTGFVAKGKRARAIPLSKAAQKFLEEAREAWPDGPFVISDGDDPIRPDNFAEDAHIGSRRAGVTDVDAHGLRRTAGARWLASGMDIYRVSRLLGHQSVTTTEQAYAGLADGHLSAAFDAVDQWAEAASNVQSITQPKRQKVKKWRGRRG